MRYTEMKRLFQIQKQFLCYGLDELIPKGRWPWYVKVLRHAIFWWSNRHPKLGSGARLRQAFETLGPVFIKLGQMLSTRRDLLPDAIADELAMLQDRVPPFCGRLAREQIETSLKTPIETLFDEFDETPLASASIAQVHSARLKSNGQQIVIKVIRPGIDKVIQADLRLMLMVAKLLESLLPMADLLRPVEVIEEYRKTIIDELNLMAEAANAIQLRRNFEGSDELYIPEIYSDYCHRNVLVMERIFGISVADREALVANGTDMHLLAKRGVEVFFTQVFRDSFFHADMHPGNIFVSYQHPENPQWIGIDCGIVGTLSKEDKRYLAENFLAFFNRDYRKVAELHVESGWVPSDTRVEEFEFALRTVLEPIFAKPLSQISFGHVLLNLFKIARRFQMSVQPQLILLQKTLLYIEGIGRQLYPELDLWQTAKPFLEKWMRQQLGPGAIFDVIRQELPFWAEKMPELPGLVYEGLKNQRQSHQQLQTIFEHYQKQRYRTGQSSYLLGIGASCMIGGVLIASQSPLLAGLAIGVALLSWLLGWFRLGG